MCDLVLCADDIKHLLKEHLPGHTVRWEHSLSFPCSLQALRLCVFAFPNRELQLAQKGFSPLLALLSRMKEPLRRTLMQGGHAGSADGGAAGRSLQGERYHHPNAWGADGQPVLDEGGGAFTAEPAALLPGTLCLAAGAQCSMCLSASSAGHAGTAQSCAQCCSSVWGKHVCSVQLHALRGICCNVSKQPASRLGVS